VAAIVTDDDARPFIIPATRRTRNRGLLRSREYILREPRKPLSSAWHIRASGTRELAVAHSLRLTAVTPRPTRRNVRSFKLTARNFRFPAVGGEGPHLPGNRPDNEREEHKGARGEDKMHAPYRSPRADLCGFAWKDRAKRSDDDETRFGSFRVEAEASVVDR